jgi:hypothetical protein
MWPREEVKEVEEDSCTCGGTKKRHGRAGAAAGDRRHDVAASGDGGTTWRDGESQQGSSERWAGELEGQVVGLERRGAAGSAGAPRRGAAGGGAEPQRETERKGREDDDVDPFVISQKNKECMVK